MPALETERLILRKFHANDLQAVFDIFSDEETNLFLPWFPLKTQAEAQDFLEEKYIEAYKEPHGFKYAICLKSNDKPIGYINLNKGDSYDFGYGLQKAYWYKGIVAEACRRALEEIKKAGIPYITATHDVNNPRSGSILKSLGMVYCYSYEELWQPKNRLVVFRMYQLNFDGQNARVYKKYWNNSKACFIEADL